MSFAAPVLPALSASVCRLWQPPASLASCIRGVMGRNTLGLSLGEAQRFNHFPATPLCSVCWWFTGETEMLAPGAVATLEAPRTPVPARMVFCGPFSRPSISWNPGPVHGMMLLLMPDAVQQMTGLDIAPWVNRMVPVAQALPPAWEAMCQAVWKAPNDDARVRCMEDFLDPLWQAARPVRPLGLHRYADWAQSVALRAALSGPGRSLRQIERRIKHWTGQPMRELRGLGRAERSFFEAMAAEEEGRLTWADVAAQSGYADQSHLCRESRRVTGFSPQELRWRILHDEGFWAYRLWQ